MIFRIRLVVFDLICPTMEPNESANNIDGK